VERDAEDLRAAHYERHVEAVQIVILDHVRIDRADARQEPANEIRLTAPGVGFCHERLDRARRVAQRDHENAIALGIEPGRLEIELRAREIIETEPAKIGAPGSDEVLLFRREREDARLVELA
jgi:hypothetical protein